MDAWLIWLIAGVFAAVGEILTAGFFLAPFAVGAFGGDARRPARRRRRGPGRRLRRADARAASALVRPIAKRHLYTPPAIRTGTAALVGRSGIVLERIANDEGVGSVRIDGEVWTARSYDDDAVIEAGAKVEIVEIRGATALVAP